MMKSVLHSSMTVAKVQIKSSQIKLSQRSLHSLSAASIATENMKKHGYGISAYEQAASKFFIQKRCITKDSWAADGLAAKGEILTSIDHKPNLFVDEAYVQGPPPAEVKRICDKILALNIVDIHILARLVTSRLGYTDEMLFPENGSGGGGGGNASEEVAEVVVAEPVVERENFDIKLVLVDPKSKIKIIKEVRAITGLGLKEAKDLVEKAPVVIKEGVKKEDIEAIKKILVDAGATVEII